MISPFHHLPDRALLRTQEEQVPLSSSQLAARRFRDISWELAETTHGLDVSITAQETPLKELVLRWDLDFPPRLPVPRRPLGAGLRQPGVARLCPRPGDGLVLCGGQRSRGAVLRREGPAPRPLLVERRPPRVLPAPGPALRRRRGKAAGAHPARGQRGVPPQRDHGLPGAAAVLQGALPRAGPAGPPRVRL